MFTAQGNRAVYYLIRSAIIMRCTEWDVYESLRRLAENPGFEEAGSETVMSRVLLALENHKEINNLPPLDK